MLRILWILSLASLTIGSRKPPWRKDFEETLPAWASSNEPLESFLPGHLPPDSDSESSSETASPVAEPETLDDDYDFDLPFQRIHVGGSTRGTPGEDFPNFTDFPPTSFSCSDQEWVPGYYADLESGCQVFHACWPDRWDSFLCHVGKIYNQELLACDHWYNSNCSLAPHYYSVNGDPEKFPPKGISQSDLNRIILTDRNMMDFIVQFLPAKAKFNILPETSDSKSKTFTKRTKRYISPAEPRDFTEEPQSTTEATVTEEALRSTQSPDCPETVKYIDVEAAVRSILDRLDNFVKDIIREAKEYTAANDAKRSCSTAHTDKISVSAKIKHKLCPKPLVPPMGEEEEPVITSKTDAAVDPTVTKPPVADCPENPVDSRIKRARPTISPLTKTALIENYINLLIKLRKS